MVGVILSVIAVVVSCGTLIFGLISFRLLRKQVSNFVEKITNFVSKTLNKDDLRDVILNRVDDLLKGESNLDNLYHKIDEILHKKVQDVEKERYQQLQEWMTDRNNLDGYIDVGFKINTPGVDVNTNDISDPDAIAEFKSTKAVNEVQIAKPIDESFPEGIPVLTSVEELDKANNEQIPTQNEYVVNDVKAEESHTKCDKYHGKKKA